MRAAHVLGFYAEGLGYEENYLGFAQASLGVEVSLVTSTQPVAVGTWKGLPGTDGLWRAAEAGVFEERGVSVHRLRPWLRARGGSQIVLRGLKRTLAEIRPDIVHLHGPVGALAIQTLGAARALGLPVVVDNHLCYHNLRPYGLVKRLYYRVLFRMALKRYASIIHRYLPLTRDCQQILHAELGAPNERMSHTTLGADTEAFNFLPSARERIRAGLGIPIDAPVVAFVGRITAGKEVETLIAAWRRVAPEHGAYLALIGPLTEGMESSLRALVEPDLNGMLKITGRALHEELPDYLSACDLGVWPAEPGISAIEAMACHLPIVYADAGAIGHLAAYGNGRFFRRGDVDDLAGTLDSILSDRGVLEEMRGQSRRLAEDVFDWRVVAARTNSVYEAVLRGNEPALPAIW